MQKRTPKKGLGPDLAQKWPERTNFMWKREHSREGSDFPENLSLNPAWALNPGPAVRKSSAAKEARREKYEGKALKHEKNEEKERPKRKL